MHAVLMKRPNWVLCVAEEEALHESAFWVTKLQGSPPSSPGVKRPREDKHDGGRTGSTSAAKLAANLADVAGRDVGPSLEVDDDSAPECVLVDPSISDEDDQQMRQAEIWYVRGCGQQPF